MLRGRKKEVSVFLPLLAFKKKGHSDVMDWEEEREQFVIHAKRGLIKTKSSQVLTEKLLFTEISLHERIIISYIL